MEANPLDAAAVDPAAAGLAAPNIRNLLAALRELESTGRFYYEASGILPVLEGEKGAALAAADTALAGIPEVAAFLGVMLIARETRLRRERGGRPRKKRPHAKRGAIAA
jgi:hypothetical protein